MNDEQVRIFLSVAEKGSFSGAEASMHISKQAMLKQINKLEDELQVRLLVRSRSGVSLTEAGELFRTGMGKLEKEMNALIKACRKADGSFSTLRVGNVEHQALLTPVTQAFTARYPQVQIRQVIHPNHSGEWRVANGVQDVAETFRLAFMQQPEAFSYRPLTTVPYVAAMRAGHPLAQKKKVSLAALAAYETMFFPIMLEPEYADAIRTAFSGQPSLLISRDDVDNQVQAAYDCVASDRLLLTANPFIEGIGELVKVPLDTGWRREYGIIFREPASPLVQKYVETALEIYG